MYFFLTIYTQFVYTIHRLCIDGGQKMEIRELRDRTGLSQSQFANYFGIPVGTLRNWEQGIAKPPAYVFEMIKLQSRRDQMINTETLMLLDKMNRLGELFKKGYKDFSDIPQDGSFEGIIYDGKHPDDEGGYPIALDIINMAEHHDIISTYDDFNGQYTIRLYLPAEEENAANYIWVKFPFDEDHSITIYEDGSWRMDSY